MRKITRTIRANSANSLAEDLVLIFVCAGTASVGLFVIGPQEGRRYNNGEYGVGTIIAGYLIMSAKRSKRTRFFSLSQDQ